MRSFCWLLISVLLLGTAILRGAEAGAKIELSEQFFNFQTIRWSDPVEHTFTIKNIGAKQAEIRTILVTAPLFFKKVRRKIEPGSSVDLAIVLQTPRPAGEYNGTVTVYFKNPELTNSVIEITGKIIPPIEVAPRPVFIVSTTRGETASATLNIVNHEPKPLYIQGVKSDSTRFKVQLGSVDPGQNYTLKLTLTGQAKAARLKEDIFLFTSSEESPVLTVPAYTVVRERVHTFPEQIDLGVIHLAELQRRPDLIQRHEETLMVYQEKGKAFKAMALTDLTFLRIVSEPARSGDRCQLTIIVDGDMLTPGKIEGNIGIQTNDPEFPLLNVPVTGEIREP